MKLSRSYYLSADSFRIFTAGYDELSAAKPFENEFLSASVQLGKYVVKEIHACISRIIL